MQGLAEFCLSLIGEYCWITRERNTRENTDVFVKYSFFPISLCLPSMQLGGTGVNLRSSLKGAGVPWFVYFILVLLPLS